MRRKHLFFTIIVIIVIYLLIKYFTNDNNDDEYKNNLFYLNKNQIESGEHIPWNIYNNDQDNQVYKKFYEIKHNYDNQRSISVDDKRILEKRRINDINKRFYTILEHTRIFGQTKYCQLKLEENIIEHYKADDKFKQIFSNNEIHKSSKLGRFNQLENCKYNNCFFTCDKTYLENADSLLFHYADLETDIQSLQQQYDFLLANRHRPHVYVLWHDEPHQISTKFDYIKFNWTMSYSTKADVSYGTYGISAKRNLKLREVQEFKKKLFDDLLKQFTKRDNDALWFVRNCKDKNRIQVAAQLSKYMDITINGACSNEIENTDKGSKKLINLIKDDKCTRDSKCESDEFNKHKFYLAFESSSCSDYITEKFWKSLSNGLIPIVIQPSKESYERLVPNNSYIHAQDFNYDFKQLAKHITKISNNYDLYSTYFQWKIDYDVFYKINDIEKYRMCELCTKLNTETSYIYYNALSKWSSNQCDERK